MNKMEAGDSKADSMITDIVDSIIGAKTEEVSDDGSSGDGKSDTPDTVNTGDTTKGTTDSTTEAQDNQTAQNQQVDHTETVDHWKTRYANLEKAFSRQGTEIGQTRKEINELRKMLEGKTSSSNTTTTDSNPKKPLEELISDPGKFVQEQLLVNELKKREEAEQQMAVQQSNVETVYSTVPEIDSLTDIVLELAKKDGVPNPTKELWISTIRTDPYNAILYARRAKEYKELSEAANRNKKVIKNIANGSRNAPLVTGSSGLSTTGKQDISLEDVDGLPTAELKRRIAALRSKR